MNIHKDLSRIKTVALFQAIEHDCNYNIIICNPVDGNFDYLKSTYEIVRDSYFEKERPEFIKVITTDDLMKDEAMMNEMPDAVKNRILVIQDQMDNIKELNKKYNSSTIKIINSHPREEVIGQVEQVVNEGPNIGRNDPCPCGSGKKFKRCCLK